MFNRKHTPIIGVCFPILQYLKMCNIYRKIEEA